MNMKYEFAQYRLASSRSCLVRNGRLRKTYHPSFVKREHMTEDLL